MQKLIHISSESLKLCQIKAYLCILEGAFNSEIEVCVCFDVVVAELAPITRLGLTDSVT